MKNDKIYIPYKKKPDDLLLNVSGCQKNLLKTFERFNSFCKDNNIPVFLLWGTLLGAKREGKIIPWDDDIDLGISPDNFLKLLNLKDKLSKCGLKLIHYSINGHIHSNEIRIYSDDLFEVCESTKTTYIKHVYIDIFPYCKVSQNNKKDTLIRNIKKYSSLLIVKETKWKSSNIIKGFLRQIYKCLLVFRSSYRLHTKIDKYVDKLYDGSDNYEITFPDTFHNTRINFFEKDSFDQLEYIDFEGIKCLVPSKADYVLTKAYGDWRKPKDRSGGKVFEKRYLLRDNNSDL